MKIMLELRQWLTLGNPHPELITMIYSSIQFKSG
jgi:hypothetical protein